MVDKKHNQNDVGPIVEFFEAHGETDKKGVFKVSRSKFLELSEKHGFDKELLKKQHAFEKSIGEAGADVAAKKLCEKIKEAKASGENPEKCEQEFDLGRYSGKDVITVKAVGEKRPGPKAPEGTKPTKIYGPSRRSIKRQSEYSVDAKERVSKMVEKAMKSK